MCQIICLSVQCVCMSSSHSWSGLKFDKQSIFSCNSTDAQEACTTPGLWDWLQLMSEWWTKASGMGEWLGSAWALEDLDTKPYSERTGEPESPLLYVMIGLKHVLPNFWYTTGGKVVGIMFTCFHEVYKRVKWDVSSQTVLFCYWVLVELQPCCAVFSLCVCLTEPSSCHKTPGAFGIYFNHIP